MSIEKTMELQVELTRRVPESADRLRTYFVGPSDAEGALIGWKWDDGTETVQYGQTYPEGTSVDALEADLREAMGL